MTGLRILMGSFAMFLKYPSTSLAGGRVTKRFKWSAIWIFITGSTLDLFLMIKHRPMKTPLAHDGLQDLDGILCYVFEISINLFGWWSSHQTVQMAHRVKLNYGVVFMSLFVGSLRLGVASCHSGVRFGTISSYLCLHSSQEKLPMLTHSFNKERAANDTGSNINNQLKNKQRNFIVICYNVNISTRAAAIDIPIKPFIIFRRFF